MTTTSASARGASVSPPQRVAESSWHWLRPASYSTPIRVGTRFVSSSLGWQRSSRRRASIGLVGPRELRRSARGSLQAASLGGWRFVRTLTGAGSARGVWAVRSGARRGAYTGVMGLHKLTAGDGYTYLTRQVAVQDATERGNSSLGDYYAERGESPGRWWGSGLAGLGHRGARPCRAPCPSTGAGSRSGAPRRDNRLAVSSCSAPRRASRGCHWGRGDR